MSSVVFSPDGTKIVGGAEDASVLVWDAVQFRIPEVADASATSADGDKDAIVPASEDTRWSQTPNPKPQTRTPKP